MGSIAPRVWLVLVGIGWGELSDARPHLEKKARSNEPADCVCVFASSCSCAYVSACTQRTSVASGL